MKNLSTVREYLNLTQKQLGEILGLDQRIIAQYESGRNYPQFKTMIKMTEELQLSFDFLVQHSDCHYPRNLKLLNLAIKLDEQDKTEGRGIIETNVKLLLNDRKNADIKSDSTTCILTNDFHSNLSQLRKANKVTQQELSHNLGISRPLLSMYEKKTFPPVENLIRLSSFFGVSVHSMATGNLLNFQFTDGHFGRKMLVADQLLTLEEHKMLILLMTRIIEDSQT